MNQQRFYISLEFFKSIYPLSFKLRQFIKQKTKFEEFKKGEIINQSGTLCNKLMIISKGMVRGYFTHEGREITTWISFDMEMFTSISGFFRNEPGIETIQALEDTVVEYMEYEDIHKCLTAFKESAIINRVLMEEYYISAENRAFMSRIPLAKDRYTFYLKNTKVEFVKRIPKKYLASLLSMQPETLTRITSAIKKNKTV
jgi:CRP/FNR family transcriptional regulator, anaerobic regulatory protein